MSSEWEYAPLGEVCSRITYGFTNPMPTIDGDGAYMVTAKDIKSGRIQYQTARKTSWSAYRERLTDKSRPGKGDLLLTKDGSIGRLALCDRGDICINQSVALLQSNGKADFRYIKYLLESPEYQRRMESDSDGSTIKHIYITRVDKMVIPLPPVKEQEGIVSILGTLDDKIELNRKTNETLEAMAKALFKSWFVDFDPVRAKAEGRPTGLPAEISDLFPDSFEDSELGEIPSGWSVETVGDISSNFDSKRVPVSGNDREKRKGEYPYYGATGIVDWVDDFLFDGIYLLIGEDGSVERGDGTAFSQYVSGKIWVNNHAHVLTGAQGVSTEHLYLYFQFIQVAPFVTGAVQLKISQGRLNSIPVVVAPSCLNDCFSGLIRKLFDQRIAMGCEMSTLASLRDALLPRLISGEIRIPDAEKMLEEVGV